MIGGAKGIGRFAESVYIDAGTKLSIWAIALKDDTTKELEAKGVEVLPLQGDVRSEEQVKRAAKEVEERLGRIDVLLNNTGLDFQLGANRGDGKGRLGPGHRNQPDRHDALYDHVLPHMIKQKSGHIINVYGGTASAKRVPTLSLKTPYALSQSS